MKTDKQTLLIALGGNALIRKGQKGNVREQFENLKVPVRQIARLSRKYRIIITHGNGPQVGNLLLQQEGCAGVPTLPLEILVAQTQGQIGYMIESSLDTALMEMGIHTNQHFITLISYVVVDENDPGFKKPVKPIGPVFTKAQAEQLPYPTVETANGFRRVVASPEPLTIVEKREIKTLIEQDFIVICCGGGGIPVIREGRAFSGVDAVIDKDLASAKLSEEVGADIFLIASDVDGAMIHFGTQKQELLREMTLAQVNQYMAEGHFPDGSMGPKVDALARFIQKGGKRAAITSIDKIESAVDGQAGTQIVP
ncbi:MAG: carbamate kinase [Desulfobacteraceae bacterium]|nr:carbamate kinase [Desulfobacteraceae bacterium]